MNLCSAYGCGEWADASGLCEKCQAKWPVELGAPLPPGSRFAPKRAKVESGGWQAKQRAAKARMEAGMEMEE